MKILFILNDPPYGTERFYNALRLAHALAKAEPGNAIVFFLMADAVSGGHRNQKVPQGYYTVERMLKQVLAAGGEVMLCGTCMDARGIADADLMEGARRGTMAELAAATMAADKVLVF